MALSSSQQKQLASIKKQAEAIQAKLGPVKSSGDMVNEGYAKALAGKNSGVNTASSVPAPAPTNTASAAPAPYSYKPDTSKSDPFYKSLLDSLKPSSEENNVQNQQTALDAELRDLRTGQGISNQNIADQTIPMSFITGQQASVENRYALKRGDVLNRQQTLQAKLANLQARRQSAMDVSKAGLEYTQGQESQAEKIARQQYEDSISNSRYSDSQSQQTLDNTYRQSQANIDNAYRQSQANKSGSGGGGGYSTSAVPQGGIDSSGGVNFISAPKKTVLAKVQSTFAPATATKIQSQLTDEQLRLFMNDYTTTQNQTQSSIMPEWYLEQWKAAAGIGTKSSSSVPFEA